MDCVGQEDDYDDYDGFMRVSYIHIAFPQLSHGVSLSVDRDVVYAYSGVNGIRMTSSNAAE